MWSTRGQKWLTLGAEKTRQRWLVLEMFDSYNIYVRKSND